MENIRRLLEISEVERSHELLLIVKNLRELGGSPFSYIIPIVPRSLPAELIEGEHFVLADLLKLVPGSFSQPTPAQKDQTEAVARTLVRSAHVSQSDSMGCPSAYKEEKDEGVVDKANRCRARRSSRLDRSSRY